MKILALEASSDVCSVALSHGTEIIEKFSSEIRQQAHYLLPFIDQVLAEAQLSLSQLDAIAISNGPGSFVGLRLGVGVAQGLAFAGYLPVIPVSSLAVWAQGVHREMQTNRVLVALNAYMGEVYFGDYEADRAGLMQPLRPDSLRQPQDVSWEEGDVVMVGSGWTAYPALRDHAHSQTALITIKPRARDVITLASPLLAAKQTSQPHTLSPFYLRTKTAWRGDS